MCYLCSMYQQNEERLLNTKFVSCPLWIQVYMDSPAFPPVSWKVFTLKVAPTWGLSHKKQSFMNISNVDPFHRMQLFKNCSSKGPFHEVQSFKKCLSTLAKSLRAINFCPHSLPAWKIHQVFV